MDTFGPGRHTITTYNIPLLIDKIGPALFNTATPFPAEVYFVSMREFTDQKWGTPQPIIVRNPGMGLGVALLQGFGTYSFQVKDSQQFVTQIVGAGAYKTEDVGPVRHAAIQAAGSAYETAAKNDIPTMIGLTEELGGRGKDR
jgi:membrane protease subunit (stomatin/prohibitin family)